MRSPCRTPASSAGDPGQTTREQLYIVTRPALTSIFLNYALNTEFIAAAGKLRKSDINIQKLKQF